MVVRVLIIACFIKLAACNPFLSSMSNAKFPAITSFATKVSPGGSTNQVPDLQPYKSYSYNVPQKITQPVDEVKLNNLNKVSRPVAITPLSVTPESYMPDKRQYNGLTFGISDSKTNTNIVDDSTITKITNDTPTPKYQHKPFSKTFNNFRENLQKTMNSGLKSKSPPTSASENLKTVHAEALKQVPKFIEHQIAPSTTPSLQQKDYLPEFVINNDMFKHQENEGVKFLMPVDVAKYKDHTVDEENILENGIQISRVPYNNNINPFIPIPKENNFGKVNPNIQAKQDVYHNLPTNKNLYSYVSQMEPLSALSFKQQESPLVVPAPAPLNQSLPVPYKEERNVSQALRIPYYNKLNPFNSKLLNHQLISDNQALRENQLSLDPNSLLQLQSRIPYNNNFNNNMFHPKSLIQPFILGNQSIQEDPLVKMNQSRSPQGNINNILPKYNDKDKSAPQIQPLKVVPPNPHKNDSVIASPDLISQPAQTLHNEEGNMSQIFKTPYYNNFYQPYSKSFSQQLIPGSQSLEECKLLTLDQKYSCEDRNETQMPPSSVIPSTLYENPIRIAGTELVSQSTQTLNGEEMPQIYRAPNYTNVNLLNPKELHVTNSQILQKNQSVKTDPLSSPQLDISKNLQHDNAINSVLPIMPQENLPEVSALEVENQHSQLSYKEKNQSEIPRVLYYNHLDPFFSRTEEIYLKKTEQLTSHETKINYTIPNNTSADKSVSQMQSISVLPSNPQLNPSQYTDSEIISQPALSADKKEPELNVNLLHSIVDGDVIHVQSLSELPSEPKDNLSEYIQLIDGTKNMRIKNEIATPAYYSESKNKSPQTSHKDNNEIFENEYQTSRMLYYNKFNPSSSRGLNQQIPPNNQLLKDNSQLFNTNQNILAQETNYGVPTNKISNKIEPQMQLFIPQPSNEKLVLPLHSLKSPDDARINSEVTKLFGTPAPKNLNSSLTHNASLIGYEPQTSRVPYYNSFNPFITYAINQQILNSSQIAKDNQFPKPNQTTMPHDSDNIMTPNKNGNKNDPQTSRLHENSALPMRYLYSDPQNSRLDNRVTKPYDTSDPKNLPGDVGSVHGIEFETSRVPNYNSCNPFLNSLSRQKIHSNKMAEDNQLIKSNQDLPPKQDVSILQINIPSQFQEKPLDSRTLNRFTNQGNSIIQNEISKVSDDSKPNKHLFTSSHDVRRFENEFQVNTIPYYNNFNSNVLNQQLSHDNQMTNEDPSNKLSITNQNTLPKLDININIPNVDNADKNIPIEITITETPDESCTEKNNNTSPNIIIDLHNKNEKPCKCLNATQKCDEISTNIEVLIPCFTKETDVTKENNYTNSTEKSSKSEESIPIVDLNLKSSDFSSYLADTILSAVQSFLIQPNSSSANNCVTENYMNIIDKNNSSCNSSEPEVLLQPNLDIPLLNTEKNISESSNKIKECTTVLHNIEEVSSPILGTHSTKQHRARILESNEVKNDTEPKVCLEPNISSDEKILNETSKKRPELNTTVINGISSNQYNKTLEPSKITKESYIVSNEIYQIPPKSDGEVLESANRIHELCTSTNKTHQVPSNFDEKPLDANKNEDTSSNQTSQILLPYFYYIDRINMTSNEANQTIPNSNIFGTSEDEERNGVMSPANDTSAIETIIDNNPQVSRTCGPKPSLSKITVNILPMTEKNNHDILVFL